MEQLSAFDTDVALPRVRDVDLVELIHDKDGFRLTLAVGTSASVIRISFRCPLAYRNTDEGVRLRTLAVLKPTGDSVLCVVDQSEWLRWFQEESYGIHDSQPIVHYAILTPDDWVDVLSATPPRVERVVRGGGFGRLCDTGRVGVED